MPRSIVMIRPIASSNKDEANVEEKLKSLVLSDDFLFETGVVFEYYMRVFGWPDFVVSLYGPNENLLKQAILQLREKCGALITSSMIGVCPEDPYLRIAEFGNDDAKKMIDELCEKGSDEKATNILVKNMRLETAKEYVALHNALLSSFCKVVDLRSENKVHQSEIEKNDKLLRLILEKVFFSNKKLSKEEKQKILDMVFKKP
jgi:hypothetical protein